MLPAMAASEAVCLCSRRLKVSFRPGIQRCMHDQLHFPSQQFLDDSASAKAAVTSLFCTTLFFAAQNLLRTTAWVIDLDRQANGAEDVEHMPSRGFGEGSHDRRQDCPARRRAGGRTSIAAVSAAQGEYNTSAKFLVAAGVSPAVWLHARQGWSQTESREEPTLRSVTRRSEWRKIAP